MYRNLRRGGGGGGGEQRKQQLPHHQQQQQQGPLSPVRSSLERKKRCSRRVIIPTVLRWVDLIFLLVVAIGIWRMASREHHYNPLVLPDLALVESSSSSNVNNRERTSAGDGSVPFSGTHACAKYDWSTLRKASGGNNPTTTKHTCQVHFPLDIMSTKTPLCKEEFCVRTFLGCESSSFVANSSSLKATLCGSNRKKRNYAALLRPLSFDGTAKAQNNQPTIGQLIVLSDGNDERGNMLAEDVVIHLPGQVLDPFRRYAKAYSKIESKMLPHAFEATDRKLYEVHGELWNNAGASALIILQYQSTVFLALAGNTVGFVAYWDGNRAEIVQNVLPSNPNSPAERKRIQLSGGIVAKDPTTHVSKVYLKNDPNAEGIVTSRVIGNGHWKLKAGVTASPVIHEVNLVDWFQQQQQHRMDEDKQQQQQQKLQQNFFVVAASHEILNYFSEQSLADKIGEALFSSHVTLDDQMKEIIKEISEKWSRRTIEQDWKTRYLDQMTLVASAVVEN